MKFDRRFFTALWAVLFLIGVVLFIWSLRSIPFDETWGVLAGLQGWKIAVLLALNLGILLLAPLRWWLILKAQGHAVPYFSLARYRLAASAISYFTPGQNFGGEPFQVIALRKHHKVSGSAALASVTLDRGIELFVNFTVLALGIAVVIASGQLIEFELQAPLLMAISVIVLAALYLSGLWTGARPLGGLLRRFKGKMGEGLKRAENNMGELIKKKPLVFTEGLAVSAGLWAALFFEFWLAINYLGLRLDLPQLVVVVTAGRLALLAPTPGALGALEASLVLAVQTLGFDASYGLSLGLLIRARDILFAVVGLAIGGLSLR